MEQKLIFGLVLGQLAILEKKLGQLKATFEGSFFMFSWTILFLNCSVCTKKLHKMKVKKLNFFLKSFTKNFK